MDFTGSRSLLRNGSYLLAAKVLAQVLRIVYLLVLARVFGPVLFGTLTFAHFWLLMLLPLAGWGTNRLLSQRLNSQPELAERHLRDLLGLRLLAISLASTVSLAGSLLWPVDELTRQLLLLFTLALGVRSLAMLLQHVFVARQQGRVVLGLELAFRMLEVLAGLLTVWLGGGLIWVALVHLLSWTAQALFSWHLLRRVQPGLRPAFDRTRLGVLLGQGASIMLVALSATAIEKSGLVILHVDGLASGAGQVALLMQILLAFMLLPNAFAVAALPVLSGQSGDRRTLHLLLRAALVGSAGVALLASALAEPLLLPLLGKAYTEALGATGVASWLLLPMSLAALLNQQITAAGHFRQAAWLGLLAALLSVGFMLLSDGLPALPRVLIAIAIGSLAWALTQSFYCARHSWLEPLLTLPRPLLAIAVALLLFRDLAAWPWLGLPLAMLVLLPGLGRPVTLWAQLQRTLRSRSDSAA